MSTTTAPANPRDAAAGRPPGPAMSWLVWRQHRGEALASVLVVAILAAVVTPNALHLYDVTGQLQANGCLGNSPGVPCGPLNDAFNATSRTLTGLLPLLSLLPGLAGMFIGAPMVAREIEDGTWRLAWSQGITRLAWLRGQLLGALAVTAGSAALLTAVLTWWLSPVDEVNGRFTNNGFDFAGVIPLAWALLAFAIGVLAGTALKRVIPAMAATLLAYAAIRLPIEFLLRPRYLPARTLWGVPFGQSGPISRNDWELAIAPVAPGGHTVLTGAQFDQAQQPAEAALSHPRIPSTNYLAELDHWLAAHGYTQVVSYQPANRFWVFQGIEAALCLVLAIAILAVACRLVLRRLT
jgi:ABC-2 family transporter protein